MIEPHAGSDPPTNPIRADVVPLGDKVDEEVLRILYSSALRLWDVVDDITRLRPERPSAYSVSIFGSARIIPGCKEYEDIRRLASSLTAMGCEVVTGGGPGLMQAANEGARAGAPDHPERSIGIRIALEFEQAANPYVGETFEHRTFFSRLHHFVLRSSAFVVTPGGIGTALELMTVWQLLQVRKLSDSPLILVGHMWSELVEWARRNMSGTEVTYADDADFALPHCVGEVDEAVEIIRKRFDHWAAGPGATSS
jgi:hypothetical protein